MKRSIGKALLVIFLGWVFFAACSLIPVRETHSGVNDVIRFHVIAHSDESEQQQLKLQVRDDVLVYLRPLLENTQNKEQAYALLLQELPEIKEVAENSLFAAGCDNKVKVVLDVLPFPAKAYGSKVFPAGEYQALEIIIGDGDGKNWWCVLFPSLCFVDVVSSGEGKFTASSNITWKYQEFIKDKRNKIFSWLWPGERKNN